MISTAALSFFVPSLVLGSVGSLYLKLGSKKFSLDIFSLLKNYNLIFGIFLSVASILLYVVSLKYTDVSKIYPLVSLNYVMILFLSVIFLKEKLTFYKIIGIIFITSGCFFVAR